MSWFKNLSVTAKLAVAISAITVLVFIMGGLTMRATTTLHDNLSSVYEEEVSMVNAVWAANTYLMGYARAELNYLLANEDDDTVRSTYRDALSSYREQINEELYAAQTLANDPEEERLLRDVESEWVAYRDISAETITLGSSSETAAQALELASTDGRVHIEALDDLLSRLNDVALEQGEEAYEAGVTAYYRSWNAAILLLFLAVAITLGLGYTLSRLIGRPIASLREAAEQVAMGDLDTKVVAHANDEIGALAESFNTMVDKVKENQRRVEAEKASVEQRVEDAVAEAEQREAKLNRRVDHLLGKMENFAEGDLRITLDESGDDAMARLYAGFNRSVARIRTLIEAIVDSTGSVASASEQISSSTEELAAGAEEQSSQTDEVAAAVEELAATILDNSQNTTQTSKAAQASRTTADEGQKIVRQTVQQMEEIATVVANTATTIERLNQSSKEIGEIIAVIDEIADQTNLLALNAAVEAARAGEHGRGFAVVADEVRKLAERTSSATGEITGMIEGIQHETTEAVESMRRGTETVSEGRELASRAGEALDGIVREVAQVEASVAQIAAANEEQSTTSDEISRNVGQISAVTSEAAQGLAQITESLDELNHLSDQLNQLTREFKTGDGSFRQVGPGGVPQAG